MALPKVGPVHVDENEEVTGAGKLLGVGGGLSPDGDGSGLTGVVHPGDNVSDLTNDANYLASDGDGSGLTGITASQVGALAPDGDGSELTGVLVDKLVSTDQDAITLGPYGTDPGQTGEIRLKELAANGSGYSVVKASDQVSGNLVQVVTLVGSPTEGTAEVTFFDQFAQIDITYDGAAFQTALEDLSNIEPGDVTVSGDAGGPWTVTFGGQYADQLLPLLTTDGSALVVETIDLFKQNPTSQDFHFTDGPGGGAFTVTYDPGGPDEAVSEPITFTPDASPTSPLIAAMQTLIADILPEGISLDDLVLSGTDYDITATAGFGQTVPDFAADGSPLQGGNPTVTSSPSTPTWKWPAVIRAGRMTSDSDGQLEITPTGTLDLNDDANIYFTRGEDDADTFSKLLAAYAAAKALTPGGNALSAANRARLVCPGGGYDAANSYLLVDTEFVDIEFQGIARIAFQDGAQAFTAGVLSAVDTTKIVPIKPNSHLYGSSATRTPHASINSSTSTVVHFEGDVTADFRVRDFLSYPVNDVPQRITGVVFNSGDNRTEVIVTPGDDGLDGVEQEFYARTSIAPIYIVVNDVRISGVHAQQLTEDGCAIAITDQTTDSQNTILSNVYCEVAEIDDQAIGLAGGFVFRGVLENVHTNGTLIATGMQFFDDVVSASIDWDAMAGQVRFCSAYGDDSFHPLAADNTVEATYEGCFSAGTGGFPASDGVVLNCIGKGLSLILSNIPSMTGTIVTTTQDAVEVRPYGSSAGNTGEVRYRELSANGTNYVGFKAADALADNVIWTLPSADAAGVFVSNGSKVLSIAARDRRIAQHTADVSTTSTNGTEDDLYSDTLSAGILATDGDAIIESGEHVVFVASATAARRLKKYFAGTLIFDSGSLTLTLGGDFSIRTEIIRESSSVVRVLVTVSTTSASTVPYVTRTRITGLTLTNTQVLKTTGIASGTGAASGDITETMARIDWQGGV